MEPSLQRSSFAGIVTRPEERGHVVFVPTNGRYLFADDAGLEVVEMLRSQRPSEEVAAELGERLRLDSAHAVALVRHVCALVTGQDPDDIMPTWAAPSHSPYVTLLEDAVGVVGQRCETFGMPF